MVLNKKGISPLIATVLIIGFTVALAAVIMVWGQGFIKDMQSRTQESTDVQLACANTQEVSLSVENVCEAAAGALKVTLKNDGSKNFNKVILRLYKSDSDISSVDLSGALGDGVGTADLLAAYGIKSYTVAATRFAPVLSTEVKQAEALPVIVVSGKDVPCAQSVSLFPVGALPADATEIGPCATA